MHLTPNIDILCFPLFPILSAIFPTFRPLNNFRGIQTKENNMHRIKLTFDAVLPVGIICEGTMGSTQLPSCRHKGQVNSPFLGL